ncbi:MAG: hypothetical protein AAFZ07_29735, partial [Actinomycetota bacterium]
MTETVLLTLGRLPKGLELARAVTAAGHRVVAVDPLALNLARTSRAVARCHRVAPPATEPERFRADLVAVDCALTVAVQLAVPASSDQALFYPQFTLLGTQRPRTEPPSDWRR